MSAVVDEHGHGHEDHHHADHHHGYGGMMRWTGFGLGLWFGLWLGLCLVVGAGPGFAQSLFRPVMTVNGTVITQYELNQRLSFLQISRRKCLLSVLIARHAAIHPGLCKLFIKADCL